MATNEEHFVKKLWNFIKQPLGTGVLILIGSALLQQWGWKWQQRYLGEQFRAAATQEQKHKTIDQVTESVGKLLTAYAMIVGAHEENVSTTQLNATIDKYHELQREWDQSEDLLKLRMTTLFPIPQIQSDWKTLLEKLGLLDSHIHDLEDFSTTDASAGHQQQIALSRSAISEIEKLLSEMNSRMTTHLDQTLSSAKE